MWMRYGSLRVALSLTRFASNHIMVIKVVGPFFLAGGRAVKLTCRWMSGGCHRCLVNIVVLFHVPITTFLIYCQNNCCWTIKLQTVQEAYSWCLETYTDWMSGSYLSETHPEGWFYHTCIVNRFSWCIDLVNFDPNHVCLSPLHTGGDVLFLPSMSVCHSVHPDFMSVL